MIYFATPLFLANDPCFYSIRQQDAAKQARRLKQKSDFGNAAATTATTAVEPCLHRGLPAGAPSNGRALNAEAPRSNGAPTKTVDMAPTSNPNHDQVHVGLR